MPSPPQVLVVFSDSHHRDALATLLAHCGLRPILSRSVSEARTILARQAICLIFCDARLADGTFRDILAEVERACARVPVVVASHLADWDHYLEAMHLGVFDYITLPCRRVEVEWVVSKALPARAMVA